MYCSKSGQTNIAYMVGKNILYTIYKENFKSKYKTYTDFESFFKIDNTFIIKLGLLFIEIFCSQLTIEIFERDFINDRFVLKVNKRFEENIKRN
jgi:hypothetical protein